MLLMLKRLWIQMTTDRRRFGAMCAILGVGLLLWARVIVIARMPRHAIADHPAPEVPVSGEPEATDNSDPAPIGIRLDAQPARDPFVISADYFPEPPPVAELDSEAGKSTSEAVEDSEQAGVLKRAQLQALVDRLKLDAVMTGLPMAVISGKTYRLGQHVPAIDHEHVRFELVEVRARSVVLTFENERFELAIAPPGAP